MKTILKITALSAVLLMMVGGFHSCKGKEKETIVMLSVLSETVWKTPILSELPCEYMQTTEIESGEVVHMGLSQIEGFLYERGFEYLLKVKKERKEQLMMDDFYSHNYSLIEIISKTEKPR
ncbi:MAG: DUF4377 domain-containing protein [Bacteroidales bacterium]|nr:DUF4377 domain-containing protein [Bacteroidales bacterium]